MCLESLQTQSICSLPVCGHSIHVSCMIQAAQYDIRCPVCRTCDPCIKARKDEDDPWINITSLLANHRTEERQYNRRRARVIREDAKIRKLNERLKCEKRTFNQVEKELEKRWLSHQKRAWRFDTKINCLKEERRKQQQKTNRLHKKVEDFVIARVGPKPNSLLLID